MRTVAITDPSAMTVAREVLLSGGVAALPTDTLYGLCVRADSAAAIEKLRGLKKREAEKPFQILFADFSDLDRVALIDKQFVDLLKTKIPGALTAIFPRRESPEITIGARVPNHPWLRELLRNFPDGIAASSVNYAGEKPANNAEEIAARFSLEAEDKINLLIDGGECRGAGSTVASFIGGKIKIFRRGTVELSETSD